MTERGHATISQAKLDAARCPGGLRPGKPTGYTMGGWPLVTCRSCGALVRADRMRPPDDRIAGIHLPAPPTFDAALP